MRERTWPAINAGLAAAGRACDDIEVIAEVIIGVGRTEEELEAARGVRNLLAFYGSTPAYRPVLDATVGVSSTPSSTPCRSVVSGRRWRRSSLTR